MQSPADHAAAFPARFRIDRLGLVIALIVVLALTLQPFALVRPNRIAAAEPVFVASALAFWQSLVVIGLALASALMMALRTALLSRLAILCLTLLALAVAIGASANYLTPAESNYTRVSPGGCFWLLFLALALAIG